MLKLPATLALRLVLIYRPEIYDAQKRKLPFSVFLEEFETLVENYSLHTSDIIFTGDFNIWVDDEGDSDAKKFLKLLSSHRLTQHIMEPTYISGHTLDLFITRKSESVLSNIRVDPGLSFHSRISCDLMLQKPPHEWKVFTTRRLKAINTTLFGQEIIQSLSSIDFVADSFDTCVGKYNNLLSNLLDKHAPAKKRRVMVRPNTPWFNEEIHAAKLKRRELEHTWRKSKLEIDRQLYCKQRQVKAYD